MHFGDVLNRTNKIGHIAFNSTSLKIVSLSFNQIIKGNILFLYS